MGCEGIIMTDSLENRQNRYRKPQLEFADKFAARTVEKKACKTQ